MISCFSRDKVRQFVAESGQDKYSNLFVGTEGDSYLVGNYYKAGRLPFMDLYDKNGDLMEIYNKEISRNDLLLRLGFHYN
jgi:hypothetical protein